MTVPATAAPEMKAEPMSEQAAMIEQFREAAAADLAVLALIHDKEIGADLLGELKAQPFSSYLGLEARSAAARQALQTLEEEIARLPVPGDANALDELAADYADVYLRYSYRASPAESVWRDPDGLERQEPMFRVKAWYRRVGFEALDMARRTPDHVVLELRFLSWLLADVANRAGLGEAARFLDAHLLTWVPVLAKRLAETHAPPFYVALAAWTAASLDDLRESLVEITGLSRRPPDQDAKKPPGKPAPEPARFVPGVAPSW